MSFMAVINARKQAETELGALRDAMKLRAARRAREREIANQQEQARNDQPDDQHHPASAE